ncbi:MAG: hypothetical protein K6B52_05910 [Clostridiales bacterium]|nr:hypothetical protein [Clostridiales bacterium]
MANCPKCNKHLRIVDWKQHCPNCGANIFVYDLQERLMQDADIAEVQYYHFQKKVDRVKAAFIGSPLAITRIITSILPVGMLFLPLVNATFKAPFSGVAANYSLLTIYKNLDKVFAMSSLLSGNADDKLFLTSFACLALSFIITVLHFVLNALACSPKGKQRNYIVDCTLLLTSAASVLLFGIMGTSGTVTGTLKIGAYLYLASQIANIAVDVLCFKKGIEIHHEQCYCGGIPIEEYFEMQKNGMTREEIRAEQYRRLQILQDEKQAQLKAKEEKAAKEAAEGGNGANE